jgi:polysaccharide export outer membrane protein
MPVFCCLVVIMAGCTGPAAHRVNVAAFAARPSYSNEQSRGAVRRSFEAGTVRNEDYRIGPGDLIEVSVFEWELRGETRTASFRVAESGIISLPVVGNIEVGGLTVAQVREHIEKELKSGGYIKAPRVTVNVVEFRSKKVAVVGAVNDPGVYVLHENATSLLDVLSLAGGVGDEAGQVAHVTLGEKSMNGQNEAEGSPSEPGRPAGESAKEKRDTSNEQVVSVDLYQLLETGDMQLNMVLQDGDTVYVPKAKSISVLGYVEQPGSFPLSKPVRVLDAIAMANGIIEEKASPKACILKRNAADGEKTIALDLTRIARGKDPNQYLQPYDVIVVRQTSSKRVLTGVKDFFRYIFNFSYAVN